MKSHATVGPVAPFVIVAVIKHPYDVVNAIAVPVVVDPAVFVVLDWNVFAVLVAAIFSLPLPQYTF
jgi:hypothetical protein